MEEAKGLPFLKGTTLKFGEGESSRILALSASRAAEGEKGSPGVGNLERRGLPAKA